MKKENICVPINSKKEAKQAKAVLKALGEKISPIFMPTKETHTHLQYYGEWTVGFEGLTGRKLTQITLKQLVELLVKEPVKEERKPLLTTEDGFDLFEGDEAWVPQRTFKIDNPYNKAWMFNISNEIIKSESAKFFKHKENALKWIENQNKPQSIKINECLEVFPNKVVISANEFLGDIELDRDVINQINNALSKLNETT